MEKLISLVPGDLRRAIAESGSSDLHRTCGSLLDCILPSPRFQQVVRELTDPEMGLCKKSREAALDLKRKGNDCFVDGDFTNALNFYSQALRLAPASSEEDRKLLSTLYVNRASSMHKLDLSEECRRDCSRALLLDSLYVKAWYRRGKANLSLQNYKDALNDLEVAFNLEKSSSSKKHIQEDLEIAIKNSKRTDLPSILSSFNKEDNVDDSHVGPCNSAVELQCISTQAKGKGMISPRSIPPASLVHCEEPLAAIVSKNCRETHCHFCFNNLPIDVLFCSSCTIPFYCSDRCQKKATEGQYEENVKGIPEHNHECGGLNWPAVLPSDVVLVGRIMTKFIEKRRNSPRINLPMEVLEDFVHHYDQMMPESKLEMHIFSVVLSCCLNSYFGPHFPLTATSAAELVILTSQMKVNSMAIMHVKSLKKNETDSSIEIEQVRVGHAIYLSGRLFNHSCQPNIHAYFLSRKLLLRSTEFIPAGFPLELSYGPQVGQWGFQDRQKFLEDQYFFACKCNGCSQLNLSDLVIQAFRCVKPTCFGAVLDSHMYSYGVVEDSPAAICNLDLSQRVYSQQRDMIDEVAHLLLERPTKVRQKHPGYCLCCNMRCDLESSVSVAETALGYIKSLKNRMSSQKNVAPALSDALKFLGQLRSVRHAYSKDVAQAEDIISEAFCLVGDLEHAVEHCKTSIMILEKLYRVDHIVIGNELVKLASLQLCLGDHAAALRSIDRLEDIFSLHYGPHAAQLFPYLKSLRREADQHETP